MTSTHPPFPSGRLSRPVSLALAGALIAIFAARASSQTPFGPNQWLPITQDGPRALCAADLDGDGDADVVVGSELDDTVAWYENVDAAGTFGPMRTIGTGVIRPEWVRAADLDGDLDLDLVVAAELGHEIVWFANLDGRGTFGPALQVTSEVIQPHAVEAVDLDGDGDLDLVSASEGDDEIAWYENLDGAGTFGPQRVIVSAADGASSLFVADMDGDGDFDVLAGWEYDDVIAWSENLDGAGDFGPPHVITDTVNKPRAVAAADLDGDGDLDVLSAAWVGSEVAWYEHLDGSHTFGPAQVLVSGSLGAYRVQSADIDQDGDQDVLYSALGSGWLENLDGHGAFGAPILFATSTVPDLLVADLDADGDVDLLQALSSADLVGWRANLLYVDLGHALAGTHGAPHLTAEGPLVADFETRFRLTNARESAATTWLAGLTRVDQPFKGGVLVPAPTLVKSGLTTDASGVLEIVFRWPKDVPPATTLSFQAWIVDPLGPEGFAASNGLAGTTPP